jgi:hypothetical protein
MIDFSTATHAYIARNKCGCVTAVCVDHPDLAKETAKDIAAYVRSGRTVERVAIEESRVMLRRCRCNEQAEPLSLFEEATNA